MLIFDIQQYLPEHPFHQVNSEKGPKVIPINPQVAEDLSKQEDIVDSPELDRMFARLDNPMYAAHIQRENEQSARVLRERPVAQLVPSPFRK